MAAEELDTLGGFLLRLQRVFYVYALCEPDGTPFYVGKGFGDRVRMHELEAKNPANRAPKHQAIREIWKLKEHVRYKLLGFYANEDDAHEEERSLIARYGRRNNGTGTLTNLTDGGEGYTEQYPSEKWDVDAKGMRVVRGLQYPNDHDMAPPSFRCAEDAIWATGSDGQRHIKAWRKPEDWTGPPMPLLAQWQGHGLTVQVFFCPNSDDHDVKTWLCLERRLRPLGGMEVPIRFRVFDGTRKLLEDEAGIAASEIGRTLWLSRKANPSEARLASERRLVASILTRLAEVPGPFGSRQRFDARSKRYYPRKLQAWIRFNRKSLLLITDALRQ